MCLLILLRLVGCAACANWLAIAVAADMPTWTAICRIIDSVALPASPPLPAAASITVAAAGTAADAIAAVAEASAVASIALGAALPRNVASSRGSVASAPATMAATNCGCRLLAHVAAGCIATWLGGKAQGAV